MKNYLSISILLCLVILFPFSIFAQEDQPDSLIEISKVIAEPATSIIISDYKYDNGNSLELNWIPSVDDQLPTGKVIGYELFRSKNDSLFERIAEFPPQTNSFQDDKVELGSSYVYYLDALTKDTVTSSAKTEAFTSEREWFNFGKISLLALALIISGSIFYFIETARRGKVLFVRKIAGLEAIDDAIGRATEMGRPILFVPGIQDLDDVQTLAGLTILGRVSRVIADYDTKITMPVSRSLVMTAGREIIKSSYQAAGRPEAYSDDMVNYITDEQFGYVAAVDGIMVREKPATCFLLGAFFAESLILAETGNSIGAIQIAGTARPAQLPFFIAACDFTLIGEELFAASAYLSGEPKQLGSLKGQDVGKAIALIVILIGVIAVTFSMAWDIAFMTSIYDFFTTIFSVSN